MRVIITWYVNFPAFFSIYSLMIKTNCVSHRRWQTYKTRLPDEEIFFFVYSLFLFLPSTLLTSIIADPTDLWEVNGSDFCGLQLIVSWLPSIHKCYPEQISKRGASNMNIVEGYYWTSCLHLVVFYSILLHRISVFDSVVAWLLSTKGYRERADR